MHLPFEHAAFDAVFLQHVAMNIEDRSALYAEVRRVLVPGGRLATYDLVRGEGEVVYPVPGRATLRPVSCSAKRIRAPRWNRPASGRSCGSMQTDTVLDWFKAVLAGPPPSGPNLDLVMGPDFAAVTANLVRNIRENRLGVLSAVLTTVEA